MANRKSLLLGFVVLIIFILLALRMCKKNSSEKLSANIHKALSDSIFTNAEYEKIVTFVLKNKVALLKYYPKLENALSTEDVLLGIIKDDPSYDASKKLEFLKNKPSLISVNLYLETSMSMYGYDNDVLIDFKRTFRAIAGNLQNNEPVIYAVNTDTFPVNIKYETLVSGNNIFNWTKNYGDPTFTDFKKIFNGILKNTTDGTVSVLFSDMIISPELSETSSKAIRGDSESMMEELFRSYSKENSVLILKFQGGFDNKYYPFTGGNGVHYEGERPFYVTIIAKNKMMDTLLKSPEFERFANWEGYERYKGYQYFTKTDAAVEPRYSIAIEKNKVGRYRRDKREMVTETNTVHLLEDVSLENDSLEIPINVDFSSLYLPDTLITNRLNYEVTKGFGIKEVKRITDDPVYTHQVIVRCLNGKLERDELTVAVKLKQNRGLASWVDSSDSVDDTNTGAENFSTTTFGLKSMLTGINNAYLSPNQFYYHFSINLKK